MGNEKGDCLFLSDEIVVKSPNDKRSYRLIQLDNGLSALLVHDPDIYPDGPPSVIFENSDHPHPTNTTDDDDDDDDGDDDEETNDDIEEEDDECSEMEEEDANSVEGNCDKAGSPTKKAAAAMCIGMGSFSDPIDAQGLAHFLEHMLFMGSSEFPDENEYDSYLSKHGGSSNAYTETEHTCYYFEVKPEFLQGALRRFSQFFVSPLVKTEAMEREVLAVDSEFNQVLQSDACRLQQLQCHTSSVGHPFNGFFWGNKKSLIDAEERGVNLREQILKLYGEYYHGGLMKLVVIGGEPLDILEKWVLELFTKVTKGLHQTPKFSVEGPIWRSGKIYRLEAVKDLLSLDLSWTMPCLRGDYLKKPEDYLAHLLGHEGSGSLHLFLKAKGWITSISAGVGDGGMDRSSIAYIFTLSIELTNLGLEKIFEIITFVYQYLKLLRQVNPQEWIFKELQDIARMEFQFAEEQPQDDYAAELAANLFAFPAEHVIYGEYAYEIWDEEKIRYVLGFFQPENMRIDILSKSFSKSQDFLQEPWFGSHYSEEDISPKLMDLWKDPPEIELSFHLPKKNEFIPCDFSLRADKPDGKLAILTTPCCILDESLMKIWYKIDNNFKIPRANAYFRINLNGGFNSIKDCLLTEIFVLLIKDKLNEIIYQASVAKLETSLSIGSEKLELRVFGFNDKIPVLLSKILAVATSFVPADDRFQVVKEDLGRNLKNTNMKPLNHLSYLRFETLCERFWDVEEKMRLLDDLTLADLKDFLPVLLSQLHIEGLCHGNLSQQEALRLSSILRASFSGQPLPVELRVRQSVICLPSGANLVRDVSVKNKLETNSVVELYFQIEPEAGNDPTKLKAFLDLFQEIVGEPLFNQLRTKEQLGYVVQCCPRITYCVHGFCFLVQSSEYDPIYLQRRIELFINGLEELLDGLTEETFAGYKGGLIAKLLEKDPSLQYETSRLWSQIVDKRYMFDFSTREAEEIRSIRKIDVLNWYKTYMKHPSPLCRKLALRVWGCSTNWKESETESESVQVIRDLACFKSSSKFYQSMC